MLASAAAKLGFDVSIYGPHADSPASRVCGQNVCAEYDDTERVIAWAKTCDAVTYEFENVPVSTAHALIDSDVIIRPGAKPLEVAQDRVVEKTFLRDCEIQTAEFAPIQEAGDIDEPLKAFGGQAILKTRRDGYDGKGQVRLVDGDDLIAAHKALQSVPCILEALVPFECEISILIARDPNGRTAIWDCPRNSHVNGILRRSVVPADIDQRAFESAQKAALRLVTALDYVGVLALEFFVLSDASVVANEFAPRVHNSGHWTPEACLTGQFEQHIRAVAGWPLGPVERFHDVEMENLLGEEALDVRPYLDAGHSVVLYGKREIKPGRKMGHIVKRMRS